MKFPVLLIIVLMNTFLTYSQDSSNVASFTFIFFGLNGSPMKSNAEEIVKKKWMIKYDMITGCLVTEELIKKVSVHNDSVKKQIAKVKGNDWEVKYNNDVTLEEKNLSEMTEILNKDPKVIQKKEKYKGEEAHLSYKFSYDEKAKIYKISFIFNETEIKKLMEFDFDFEKKNYSIVNSQLDFIISFNKIQFIIFAQNF